MLTKYRTTGRKKKKMSMVELGNLIKEEKITVQMMNELYRVYGFGFIIKDGKIKGFTR